MSVKVPPDWPTAAAYLPERGSLTALRDAAAGCRGCPLWEPATQTVFGRGPATARLVLVGEQPGDVEDRDGKPFVGPAGRLLVKALEEAGIDKSATYVTNAVKHFRFTPTPKRRIHATPDTVHVEACKPWLTAELRAIDPELVVLLGATAIRSLLGTSVKVTRDRGTLIERETTLGTKRFLVTPHPSAVLRADDREAAYSALVHDLRVAAAALG
ncbi:MAG: uracil-DNA glycosylase [Frankiaceae bacterium]|nr:uracil-DNA glycosylase [Frankiaceae bacterium]